MIRNDTWSYGDALIKKTESNTAYGTEETSSRGEETLEDLSVARIMWESAASKPTVVGIVKLRPIDWYVIG